MSKKRNNKNNKNKKNNNEKSDSFVFPLQLKRGVWGILFFVLSLIIVFSFFDASGYVGSVFSRVMNFLIGKTANVVPIIFLLCSSIFFYSQYKKFTIPLILASSLLILGISGALGGLSQGQISETEGENLTVNLGGWIGYVLSSFFVKLFGFLISQFIFGIITFIGILIFWHLIKRPSTPQVKERSLEEEVPKTTFIKKIFSPKFKLKEISGEENNQRPQKIEKPSAELELKKAPEPQLKSLWEYQAPPLDLLEADSGEPSSGDIKANSAIIKKTLQNFDIPVEMSEINIGPTVTQYTLKPAEGVKLSKITALSNDLSLALAAHSIRIEAPVPGRSLVGVEIPNKVRAQVRMRNLMSNSSFGYSIPGLTLALGKDVAGNSIFTDLAKMPHMLVAGSTGSGKTIFLNSLLLNLLYKNSPASLRLILVDPKRVEFPVYADLPHLLCPVIYNANLTLNALRWLTGEMERRFDVLVQAGTRDIRGYNQIIAKKVWPSHSSKEISADLEPMPYIVLIIDELADIMAVKGREIEAFVVRIAQMARAVGIHLVLATQRPSVEVITGLIKANIATRITFQVVSQVDSRTILDMAGAEKLLGAGDMLYVAGDVAKPRRVQCAYVSEKELKKVVDFVKTNTKSPNNSEFGNDVLTGGVMSEGLQEALMQPEGNFDNYSQGDDTLYEEAKKIVIEAKKASASLLQRRLRIGYARAARLIDMLEDKGIVGPAEGARPREIYFNNVDIKSNNEAVDGDGWKKV